MGVEGLGRVLRSWEGCGKPEIGVESFGGCGGLGLGVEGLILVWRAWGGCKGPGMGVEGFRWV